MYEVVEDNGRLYLAKKRGDDHHYTTVAFFSGEAHECRDLALEIVEVLNKRCATVLVEEKADEDEDRLDGEAWKPATDPSYDDTGA